MIKNILIPERLGNYYIFPKRVVGFDIDKTHVTATQIYLKGKTVTIERCLDELLDSGNELTHEEKIVKAIQNIVQKLDKFDEVYTSISSLNVIFKSLRLPFTKYEKIKSVINFEVEPLLPFSSSQAVIDFIVVKEIPGENSSEVMVAAVQKSTVDEHIKFFIDAGISPLKVSVDLFSLYSFYKNIPEYKDLTGNIVLVDLGFNLTRIAFICEGKISFVRTFPKGILSQAKDFAKAYSIPQNEAAEVIMRYGYQKQDDQLYKDTIEKVSSGFWSEIRFTLQSFVSKLSQGSEISRVLILGQGAKMGGVTDFVGKFLSVDCQIFRTATLTSDSNVTIKNSLSIPSSNIISLATVFPSQITEKFNLYKDAGFIASEKLVARQLIVMIAFVFIVFSMLFVNNYIKIGNLQNEISASEQEVIERLKKKFKLSDTDNTMEEALTTARSELDKLEKVVFFAGKDRFSYLRYLLGITEVIDKEGTGIKVEALKISQVENNMILSGEVKNYDALNKLTRDIRAKKELFSFVPTVHEWKKFDMKIELAKKK